MRRVDLFLSNAKYIIIGLALVSIYGPNETDSAFLTQISKTLLEEIDCPLVVGGDFNALIHPALDKSQSDTTAIHPLNY